MLILFAQMLSLGEKKKNKIKTLAKRFQTYKCRNWGGFALIATSLFASLELNG